MIYDEETGGTYHYTLKMGRDSNPLTNIVQIDEPVLKRVWDHLVDPDKAWTTNREALQGNPKKHHEYGFYLPPLSKFLTPRQVRIERDYPLSGGYDLLVHVYWSIQQLPSGVWKPLISRDGFPCSIWRDMHQPRDCYECRVEHERTYWVLSANAEPAAQWKPPCQT